VHDLLRKSAPFAELSRSLARFLVQCLEGGIVPIEGRHLLGLDHDGIEVPVARGVLNRRGALFTLQQQLDASKAALDLADPRDDTHGVQNLGVGLVRVVSLRDGKHQPVAFERGFDRAEGTRASGGNGCRDAREDHRAPKR
jgi:hypothetical protein